MILNEAEEQRKVANSAPLTSAEVVQTALGSTASAATPATASGALSPGGKAASLLSEALAPGPVPLALRKTARVAGNVATAVTEAAGKLSRPQGSAEDRSAGSQTELPLTALAPASAGLQHAVAAAQEQ